MSVPFVGVDPPAGCHADEQAFALFASAPSKQTKDALKAIAPAKAKLSFQKDKLLMTLKSGTKQSVVVAFWTKAAKLAPMELAYRGVWGVAPRRAPAHRAALEVAAGLLSRFDADLGETKNTIGRRFGQGLVLELYLGEPGRAFTHAQAAALEPLLDDQRLNRSRAFFMAMANEPETLMGQIDDIVWDCVDAVACLVVIEERLTMWGELLDDEKGEAALHLGRRLLLEGAPAGRERDLANALWVAWTAARIAKDSGANKLEKLVRARGGAASVKLVYADLRRSTGDKRLVALADEVLTADAEQLAAAANWSVRRDPAIALDLFDRAASDPNIPWQAINNGVAMLMTVHAGKIPPKLAKRWLARIEPLTEAPARHNLACLLARLGRRDEARAATLEAITGGADLDPICGDAELKAVLDDAELVSALNAREADPGARARLEAMRLLTLGDEDGAMLALIEAAKGGADPDELKYGDPFEALHDHPHMRRVRRPAKKPKRA